MSNSLSNIKSEMLDFLNKFKAFSIRDRQLLFLQCIMIFDKSYCDMITSNSEETQSFLSELLRYGYPTFVKQFYDVNFEKQIGVPLKALDEAKLNLCAKILFACKTIGWIEFVEENEKYGNFIVSQNGKTIKIKFSKKYHWNEFIENQYHLLYSEIMIFARLKEYEQLEKDKKRILSKMRDMVSVWCEKFMSYSNDMEVEEYFHAYAELDMEQDTNWDMFKSCDSFNNVKYQDYVYSIMDYMGYAIKHCYFANILTQKFPELLMENFFYLCKEEDAIVELIAKNREIDPEKARCIFSGLVLNRSNVSMYDKAAYCLAPFIKISHTQVVQSIAGSLHSPFDFMLQNLERNCKKEWSYNVGNREALFKKELYSIFKEGNYICLEKNVVITSELYGKTDIDAIVIDKISGEIALFQLKWQGQTYISARAMNSKARNFTSETKKWLTIINDWMKNSSEEKISSLFGVPKKHVDKNKIYTFVLGRHHANYSADEIIDDGCVWGQWYQFASGLRYIDESKPKISQFYALLKKQSPFNQKYNEKPTIFQIGEYKIAYGNTSAINE